MLSPDVRLFYVPVPDAECGLRLARGAVAAHLAACANLLGPMTSLYEWEGRIEESTERLLILKTGTDRVEALQAWLAAEHPYDVPCILHGRPDGAWAPFAEWVHARTR
jgi:periplasmic divalent cation tolerance protein